MLCRTTVSEEPATSTFKAKIISSALKKEAVDTSGTLVLTVYMKSQREDRNRDIHRLENIKTRIHY
jgi:hypothetical protein